MVTQVKPKAQAQEEYRLAVEQGHSAVLLAQAPAASLFEVSVGNLEAMSEAVVEVRYLRMLDTISDALEWVHTATWVPPYIGSAGDQAAGLQQVAAAEPKFAHKVSYTLSYAVTVHGGAPRAPAAASRARARPTRRVRSRGESRKQLMPGAADSFGRGGCANPHGSVHGT